MHPLLTTRRLALYLLAWTPVIAMLAAASRTAGAPVWARLAVYAPACVLFAFVCLSPWQICRARPLTPANAVGLAVTFTAAGFVGGCLLAGAAAAIAYSVGRPAIVSGNLAAALVAGGTLAYLLSAGVHYTALGVEASLQADKRFGERLRVEMEIAPECEECAVPALLLQPLVENAVKHGIGGLIEGGAIRLAASRSDGKVSITVRNPFRSEE